MTSRPGPSRRRHRADPDPGSCSTSQIFYRPRSLGIVVGVPVAGIRRSDQAARRRVPADDQDDHRAAAVLDAGRRHRRHRRPEGDGPDRPQGDHLLRGRDDDRAGPRPRAGQHLQAGRRPGAAARRRHRRRSRRWRRTSSTPGTSCCTCSRPRSSTRWRAATSCRSWSSRRSSASRWPRSAPKGQPVLDVLESTAQVMFKVTGYVMAFAPIGVFAAIAATVGGKGLGILLTLGKLVALMYLGPRALRADRHRRRVVPDPRAVPHVRRRRSASRS